MRTPYRVRYLWNYGVFFIVLSVGWLTLERWLPDWSLDLTKSQKHTLAVELEESLAVTLSQDMQTSLKWTLYYKDHEQKRSFESLIMPFKRAGYHIDTQYLDIDRYPSQALQAEIQTAPTLLMRSGQRQYKLTTLTAPRIVVALRHLAQDRDVKIYFSTGHGEPHLDDHGSHGFAEFAFQLRERDYQVNALSLAQGHQVPKDASLVVLAGLNADLLPIEVAVLEAYLRSGGALLVLADGLTAFPELNRLLALAGLKLNDDLLMLDYQDSRRRILGGESILAYPLQRHHSFFRQGSGRFFEQLILTQARSVGFIKPRPDYVWYETVAHTDPQTLRVQGVFTSRDLHSVADSRMSHGQVPVLAHARFAWPVEVASKGQPVAPHRGQVVLLGSSAVAVNQGFRARSVNQTLMLNITHQLLGEQLGAAFALAESEVAVFELPPDSGRLWLGLLAFGLPGVLAGFGVLRWLL